MYFSLSLCRVISTLSYCDMSSLADIDPSAVDDVLPVIPNATSLLIHTGNIINRGFIYKRSPSVTEEIKITCSKTLGKWTSGVNKHETKNVTSVDMDHCQLTKSANITEERKNLKITVKLFVVNDGPECVREALNIVGEKLNTRFVETLILSLPGTSHGSNVTYNDLVGPFWEAAENQTNFTFNDQAHHTQCTNGPSDEEAVDKSSDTVTSEDAISPSNSPRRNNKDVYISWTIGLSDLNAASLRDVYDNAAVEKPSIDQINMDVCCSPPGDLVTMCREHDIQLLTHNDPRDILNQDAMYEILSSHLNHEKDMIGWRVGWVLRYSALVKCRGIIHTKGYIVSFVRNNPQLSSPVIEPGSGSAPNTTAAIGFAH